MALTVASRTVLPGPISTAVFPSGRKGQPTCTHACLSQFLAGSAQLGSFQRHRQQPVRAAKAHQAVRSMAAEGLKERMLQEMAIEKRLQAQVLDGKVKPLSPKEAGYLVKLSGYTLLDVRPSHEHDKAYVKNSLWIPMYEVDKHMDPGSLSKRFTNFIFAGWWDGSMYMTCNERFMPDVAAAVRNKEAPIIVACQKGLRSLAACEAMRKAGYKNLHWLIGGFDAADDADFDKAGSKPFKYAGIGGVQEFLGYSDIQRREAKKDGFRLASLGRLAILFLLADGLFLGAQQLIRVLHPES